VLRRAVGDADLVPANAALQAVTQGLKVIGPALGGALLAVLAPRALIAVNAVTFLISAVALLAVRTPAAPGPARPWRGYWAELRTGLSFVVGQPALRLTVTALGATVALTLLFDSMLPLAVTGLGLPATYIGYVIAAVGLGGVGGALLLARWGAGARPFLLIAAGQVTTGVVVALTGLAIVAAVRLPAPALLAAGLLIGASGAGVLVGFPTVVHTVTPDGLTGRVWTAIAAVPAVLAVGAPLAAAAVIARTGVGWLFAAGGLALALLGVAVASRQRALTQTSTDRWSSTTAHL